MPLRICQIGAGSFSNTHLLPQLRRHDVRPAAICDLDEQRADDARRRYGFGEAYREFEKMLEKQQPDAVFCVTGPVGHYEIGIQVLDRGFPLYIQKPPAPDSAATQELAEMARQRGVVCHVGFNMRSAPAIVEGRRIVGGDDFGNPLMGMFRYGLCSGATMRDVVIDQHCHLVDLARFMMGDVEAISVRASAVEDRRDYVCSLEFASGAVGTLNFTSGQLMDREFIYIEVTGPHGFIYSHGGADLMWRREGEGAWWQNPEPDMCIRRGWFGDMAGEEAMGYIGDVANFLAAVRGEAPDRAPIGDTIQTMEICEEILEQMGEESDD